jgi:hypothetical protein
MAIELGFALRDYGLRRCLLGFALGHLAPGGIDADERPLQLRFGLTVLRLEHCGVHPGQNLPGLDEVAFVHQDIPDPARYLGRDIDLHRLDPTVAAGNTLRQRLRFEPLPSEKASAHAEVAHGEPRNPNPA